MKNTYTADQATDFLRKHYREPRLTATELGAGEWSQAFEFEHEGRNLVLRLGSHRDDFARDQLASRYSSPHLPVPKVLELGDALEAHFAISERIYGQMIDDLDQPAMRAMVPELLKLFDAIRTVDISQSRGYGPQDSGGRGRFKSWPEFLLAVNHEGTFTRMTGWRRKLEESELGADAFDQAYAVLANSLGQYPETRFLIHNDLLHYNVLVQDGHITGVIDWANAMYGDFLYDLAQYVFWAHWFPAMDGLDWAAEAQHHFVAIGLEVPQFEKRLRACLIHTGLSAQVYHAHTNNWESLAGTSRRTLEAAGLLTSK